MASDLKRWAVRQISLRPRSAERFGAHLKQSRPRWQPCRKLCPPRIVKSPLQLPHFAHARCRTTCDHGHEHRLAAPRGRRGRLTPHCAACCLLTSSAAAAAFLHTWGNALRRSLPGSCLQMATHTSNGKSARLTGMPRPAGGLRPRITQRQALSCYRAGLRPLCSGTHAHEKPASFGTCDTQTVP